MVRNLLPASLVASAAALVLAASTQLTASPAAAPPPALQAEMPEGPGRSAALDLCGRCHAPNVLVERLRTTAEWSEVIEKMVGFGAGGTDAQYELLNQYLLANSVRLDVNTGTAKELMLVVAIPEEAATAIVNHRTQNGSFKAFEDLAKVPGVDVAKLEARKDRLSF